MYSIVCIIIVKYLLYFTTGNGNNLNNLLRIIMIIIVISIIMMMMRIFFCCWNLLSLKNCDPWHELYSCYVVFLDKQKKNFFVNIYINWTVLQVSNRLYEYKKFVNQSHNFYHNLNKT